MTTIDRSQGTSASSARLTEARNGATDKLEARLTSTFERNEGNESRETIRGR